MKDLQGNTVLVLGLGDSGLAMARWCARQGARVRVWDSREQPPQAEALRQHVPQAELMTGALEATALDGVQLVLKSPGLSPRDERLGALLAQARQTGVPVQGELDLFALALAELKATRRYAPKVVAITGTNGKTTTTAMAALLIERAGRRVAAAGNIGPTMLQTLSDALDLEPETVHDAQAEGVRTADAALADGVQAAPLNEPDDHGIDVDADVHADADADAQADIDVGTDTDEIRAQTETGPEAEAAALPIAPPPPAAPVFEHLPDVWVLELSSFQLDGVQHFEPSAGAVLNITQDHLDWHGDMAAYAEAKARIFGRDAVMVINRDDPQVEAMVPAPVPQKGRFARPLERHVVRFGLDAPRRPGDYGVVTTAGMAWLVRAMESDDTPRAGRRRKEAEAAEDLHIQRLMPADALRVRGRHNAANALAALALATAIGCPLAPMLHGLREYTGEPHRVEFVGTVKDVDFYDDSKGTNVGATVAAINGLGPEREPARLLVILGGDGKGQDFTPLAAPVARHARFVALIGRDAEAIARALGDAVPQARFDSLQAATRACAERAQPGDAVLMSPACASLDMFRNYAHRAEVFVAEVQALASDVGELGA